MSLGQKTLWVASYSKLKTFVDMAVTIGATHVAIRTSNNVAAAIKPFHDVGIRVYGWRWPYSQRTRAMAEAANAVSLFQKGLDGYIADPEGAPGDPWDWNLSNLEQLAEDFCAAIVSGASGKPFGVTSHYRGRSVYPALPWKQFFDVATVLLPQAYWRVTQGPVGSGKPVPNYNESINQWVATGGQRSLIVPMAGELAEVTDTEVTQYAAHASASGIDNGHFYTFGSSVPKAVWAAIAAA
jgi:hypothetical protein